MDAAILLLIPIGAGLIVNLITAIFTAKKPEKEISINQVNGGKISIVKDSYNTDNSKTTNNTTNNIYNDKTTTSSGSSDAIFYGILGILGVSFATYYILQSFKFVIIGIVLFALFTMCSLINSRNRISKLNIPDRHKQIIYSQVKFIKNKIVISLIFLIALSIRYYTGSYNSFIEIVSINEFSAYMFENHVAMGIAISLVITLLAIVFQLLFSSTCAISISVKPVLYTISEESFTFSVLSPLARIVKDKELSDPLIRKKSIYTFIIFMVIFVGPEIIFNLFTGQTLII